MRIWKTAGATALALAVMLGATAAALSQQAEEMPQAAGPGMMGQMAPGMMGQGYGPGPGMMGQGYGMGPGMMGQGMGHGYGPGPGMMGHDYGPGPMVPGMGQGYGPGPGMMGQMGPGMMRHGMMHPGMGQGYGPGPMGPGMMGHAHPFRIVPTMDLSTDDVRRFLQRHISAHGLMHLQVGEVTRTDDQTITADIVTREGSLALRLEIDPYTGFVKGVS